jgi:hypothetical protein
VLYRGSALDGCDLAEDLCSNGAHTYITTIEKDEASAEAEKGNPPRYEILGHANKVYKLKKTL